MLSRWIALSSRTSFASSSRSSLPSIPIVSRRSIYSSLPRKNEASTSEPTTPSPSSTSTTSTTSTPSPPSSRPKAPSLFVANPDGSFTTSPRPHPPSSPPSPRPPTPKPVSRLRQHLSQWIQFKALPEEEKLEIEKKIRKKVKAVEGISTTMAKWYSDPIPYITPPPAEMFGVDRNRKQGLSWVPTVGDRVLTPFNSYGVITAIRPASEVKLHPKKVARQQQLEDQARAVLKDDEEHIDPTWSKAPSTPEVQKLDVEMPADWILMSSKNGPFAGAVEKKLAMDEAKRIRGGGKAVVGSIGADGKIVKEELKVVKMIAEVRNETDVEIRERPFAHPIEGLQYAPLSQSNLSALLLETGHSSIPSAQDSGYFPSPPTLLSSLWSPSSSSTSSSLFSPSSASQPTPMALRPPRSTLAGTGVPGREGFLRRIEATEKDIRGGEDLVGAPRRLLDREKKKLWSSQEKMLDERQRRERFESFEAPPEGSGIVVRKRAWRTAGGLRKSKDGDGERKGPKGYGLD